MAYSQCNTLAQQRTVDYETNGSCAPVMVTKFTITYTFLTAQNPANIWILFYWNDPANTIDRIDSGSGLVALSGNTKFQANATFTYTRDANCSFSPQAYIEVSGTRCESSLQTQLVSAWDNDDNFGGTLAITPNPYNVCFGNAISNAVFTDNSTFNCNQNQNADNPNQQARHVQFVYGTNHNAANSIADLTLVDGTTRVLTNSTGGLASSTTRGTVTGAYFGPIQNIPFPANAPTSQSFPISAPANTANAVGATFQVTMYNWNTCNPWNGDTANPNYADAVSETAVIRIVNPPAPDFQSRYQTASGAVQSVFCIDENVYFQNQTTGTYTYLWQFYNDASGTALLGTSTARNPTRSFNSSGQKLIRLTATDASVQGACSVSHEELITLSPSAVANIELYDETFTTRGNGDFCQTGGAAFRVGFRDATTGIEPDTRWRWEFYNENNVLIESQPAGAGTYSTTQITNFTRGLHDYRVHKGTPDCPKCGYSVRKHC